jgi:hypothetical protein
VSEWKLIETAPRNEWVLVSWVGTDGGMNLGRLGPHDKIYGRECWHGESYIFIRPPTHWMPLPKPPVGK